MSQFSSSISTPYTERHPAALTPGSSNAARVSGETSVSSAKNTPEAPLQQGQTVRGEVTNLIGSRVTVQLEDGTSLQARLDSAVNLSIGQHTSFEVTQADQSQITLRLLPDDTAAAQNNLIGKALDAAGLPASERAVTVVRELLANQMSIDKNSIQQLMRQSIAFRDASVSTLALMNKYQLPVNPVTTAQFEAYRNYEHRILQQVSTLADNLSGLAGQNMDGLRSVLQELLSSSQVYGNGTQQTGEGTPLNAAPPAGAPALDGLGLSNAQAGMNGLAQNGSQAGVEGLAQNAQAGVESLAQNAQAGVEGLAQNGTQAGADGLAQGNMQAGADGLIQGGLQAGENGLQGNMQAADGLAQNNTQATNGLLQNNAQAANGLAQGNAQAANELLQNNAPASAEALLQTNAQAAPGGLLPNGTQAANGVQSNPQAADAQSLEGTILSAATAGSEASSSAALTSLLTEGILTPEHLHALTAELVSRWTLSPQDLKKDNAVGRYYERLSSDLKQLKKALAQQGGTDSPELEKLNSTVRNLQENLDFLNLLNRLFSYVQLPMRFADKTAHGDLYVYTKKEKLREDNSNISILLHLDMDSLGPTDVYLNLTNTSLASRFYLNDSAAKDLFTANLPELKQTLADKGFELSYEVLQRDHTVDLVKDFLAGEDTAATSTKRFSFDCRA